ncbi:MAG TPA: class I adenylate-forming enzyme family protein [Pseudolabrys sp.]|nr:class I adenylate-forming enzyme family protein [Pseudolabrys sp.]
MARRMIADGAQKSDDNRATLDNLFRRAGVRRSDALALSDPQRSLTYAQADRAISAFAARLRTLGLSTDAVVALQLPHTVESVVAFLGILRAGMIVAPLPLLWREQEMTVALAKAGAKAIVTHSALAEVAMQVAAKLFPIRAVAGFGPGLPDGVVSLDDVFAAGGDHFHPSLRPGNAAAHAAAITFDITADGIAPIARSQGELIAVGRDVFLEDGIADDATILSTIPLSSFAGIALALVPWMLSGGTLALHHGFDPAVFDDQRHEQEASVVVLPGPVLTAIANAGLLDTIKTVVALWRTPEALANARPWQGEAAIVDVICQGETELRAARRANDGLPVPIPPTPSSAGITVVGGYRFRQSDIDAAVAAADPAAIIAALPDALLGQRLAGSARDNLAVAAHLQAQGSNALVAGAFRRRGMDA